jgi:hypothetical protein
LITWPRPFNTAPSIGAYGERIPSASFSIPQSSQSLKRQGRSAAGRTSGSLAVKPKGSSALGSECRCAGWHSLSQRHHVLTSICGIVRPSGKARIFCRAGKICVRTVACCPDQNLASSREKKRGFTLPMLLIPNVNVVFARHFRVPLPDPSGFGEISFSPMIRLQSFEYPGCGVFGHRRSRCSRRIRDCQSTVTAN